MRTKWTWLGWSAPIFPFMTPAASWLAGEAAGASSPLVGFDRLALYNLMVECPCKENRPNSGWLMTQSHSGRGFGFFFAQLAGWLVAWLVGWLASLLSGQTNWFPLWKPRLKPTNQQAQRFYTSYETLGGGEKKMFGSGWELNQASVGWMVGR